MPLQQVKQHAEQTAHTLVDRKDLQVEIRRASTEIDRLDVLIDALPHRDRASNSVKKLRGFIAMLTKMAGSPGGFRSKG